MASEKIIIPKKYFLFFQNKFVSRYEKNNNSKKIFFLKSFVVWFEKNILFFLIA